MKTVGFRSLEEELWQIRICLGKVSISEEVDRVMAEMGFKDSAPIGLNAFQEQVATVEREFGLSSQAAHIPGLAGIASRMEPIEAAAMAECRWKRVFERFDSRANQLLWVLSMLFRTIHKLVMGVIRRFG